MNIKESLKNIKLPSMLQLLIAICFIAAGERVYKFVKLHTPPYAVGECLKTSEFEFVGEEIVLKVLENDILEGTSTLEGQIFFAKEASFVYKFKIKFEEMRNSKTEKVKCL